MKNFKINEHKGIISNEFLIRKIDNFLDACRFIALWNIRGKCIADLQKVDEV